MQVSVCVPWSSRGKGERREGGDVALALLVPTQERESMQGKQRWWLPHLHFLLNVSVSAFFV